MIWLLRLERLDKFLISHMITQLAHHIYQDIDISQKKSRKTMSNVLSISPNFQMVFFQCARSWVPHVHLKYEYDEKHKFCKS